MIKHVRRQEDGRSFPFHSLNKTGDSSEVIVSREEGQYSREGEPEEE